MSNKISPALTLLLFLLTASCAALTGGGGGDNYASDAEPPPDYVYYEFNDVAVPRELSRDEGATFIVDSPPMKSGVMVFDGGTDRASLVDFFINSMPRDGWNLRSIFKAQRSLLICEKNNRYCVIGVGPGRYISNRVEIWVTTESSVSPAFSFDSSKILSDKILGASAYSASFDEKRIKE